MRKNPLLAATAATMFFTSFALILFELLLTRLFAVVLFAQFAHLALALALLGISVGATIQHLWPQALPDEELERRLAWLVMAQGLLTVAAVACTVGFPIIEQFEKPPPNYQSRAKVKDTLLNVWWLAALLPVLTAPFVAAGLSFAGTFQRRRQHIGLLYGADLIGGAVGAVIFIPVLGWLAGPDAVFFIALTTSVAAAVLFRTVGSRKPAALATAAAVVFAALVGVGLSGKDLLRVRYAAGYSEDNVTLSQWTALTRLSIHKDARRTIMLLDNTSASEIFTTEKRRKKVSDRVGARTIIYQFRPPPARVAVLAASAGPEVAVAQYWGHKDIDAIDIAAEIFDIVADNFPDSPANPYTQGNTKRVKSDGRAAILHSPEPYDIIHMVHANLWSSAGRIANAWSPSLLETKEAFSTYLDKLSDDGTLSFARGGWTDPIVRAAAAALKERGVKNPARHMLYVTKRGPLLLKPRPWTQKERDRVVEIIGPRRARKMIIDPMAKLTRKTRRLMYRGPVMTDDRPYLDGSRMVGRHLTRAMKIWKKDVDQTAFAALYRSIVIQCLFVLLAGLLFVFVPLARRGPQQLGGVKGVGWGLLYVCALGYGYLAIETVLVHELVLYVGHPTYAITVVILSMLLFSGLGSMVTGRLPEERLTPILRFALIAVIALGLVQAYLAPGLLHKFGLGWPLPVRVATTFVILAPLGFIMGIPFPLAMRILPKAAGGMVPWAWALNGFMSVVASLVSVLLCRAYGYSYAFTVGLLAYGVALLLAGRLRKIGQPGG